MKEEYKTTFGKPYADISPSGKFKYLKFLKLLNRSFSFLFVLLLLGNGFYLALKAHTSTFVEYIFDDGTPVKCVLSEKDQRPVPSTTLITERK